MTHISSLQAQLDSAIWLSESPPTPRVTSARFDLSTWMVRVGAGIMGVSLISLLAVVGGAL